MEETAKHYLDELAERWMVQVVDRSASVATRKVKSFRLHDLFCDFCISKAKEDGFSTVLNGHSNCVLCEAAEAAASRCLVLSADANGNLFRDTEHRAPTVVGFGLNPADPVLLRSNVCGFKLLRVLDLHFRWDLQSESVTLPNEISTLVHLRYIRFRSKARNILLLLPCCIGKLNCLETFDVRGTHIDKIPKSFCKIRTLKHIFTQNVCSLHPGVGNLASLETLTRVTAGSWMQRDLAKMSSLRKLATYGVSEEEASALSPSRCKLTYLTSLFLKTYQSIPASSLFFAPVPTHQHLSKLSLSGPWTTIHGLPPNLIHLKLRFCELDRQCMASLQRLPSLVVVILGGCNLAEEEMEFSSNGFPRLRELVVDSLNGWRSWRIKSGALPKLTHLQIECCRQLEMLPD